MHTRPERREDADAPVADLVAEALDDDGAIRRHGAGRVLLVAEEREQILRSLLVEGVLARQPLESLLLGKGDQLPRGFADRLAELVRTPRPLSLPERDQARHPRGGRDEDPVARDLLDPPARCAEEECLAGAGLVDHLLVELTHAATAVDEMDAEQPAVGDRARVRDRELAHATPPLDHSSGAVPDDPGPQLGELVGRIPPGEHVEDVLELDAGEIAEVVGPAHEIVQLVDRDLLVGADGDDLLCEHVERVAWDHRLLDRAGLHALDDDGRLEQVGAELREDTAARDCAELVSRSTHSLQAPRHGLGRLDLDHEVDRSHVDSEL